MSQLTLTLVQLGFLALLWLMVLSVASVMRSDLFARRRAKASARADARAARSAAKASAKAASRAAAVPAAATGAAAGAAATARPAKPRKGSPRLLVVTSGAQQGLTVELGATPITIGRAPENTVSLDDDYVSGRHARVYPHEGAWVVEDLGSTNGTFLGKARVNSPTVVPAGGVVRIGKSELELRK